MGYPQQVPSQCDLGGLITTGGGFSNYYSTPSWQAQQVSNYFKTVSPLPSTNSSIDIEDDYSQTDTTMISGVYNASNRGYPDISAWSSYVWVNVDGVLNQVAGTSVATPVVRTYILILIFDDNPNFNPNPNTNSNTNSLLLLFL